VESGDHKRLRAYQLSRTVGRALRTQVAAWPSFEQWSLGLQVVRAADSIGANIAEASGRWHRADQLRLLYIARGSLRELEHWIDIGEEMGLLSPETHKPLPELARTLAGLIRRRRQ
jgi:four helix bundle protein